MYTMNDPKWVQAQHVEAADSSGERVNVKAYGETFSGYNIEWSNIAMDKTKSDVLVCNSRGDWLRVWFYDADIVPYR